MKVFVTGASGYLGGSVMSALARAGHNVAGLVRTEPHANLLKDRGIENSGAHGTLHEPRLSMAYSRLAASKLTRARVFPKNSH